MASEHDAAISSIGYLVRWLLAVPEDKRTGVVGGDAKPWCELLERVTRRMSRELRSVVVPLLSVVTRKTEALTPEQRSLVGTAARRVLDFAWGESHRDAGLIRCAIDAVCRTFDSAPADSVILLSRLIEPSHLVAHGFDELPTLVRELERLIPAAPTFVEQVYGAALSFTETDEAPTALGGASAIFPLRSNRRQDYRLGQYQLGKLFPRFMAAAPVEATGAVIRAVETKVAEYERVTVEEPIRFVGIDARFEEDASHVWDSSRHRHDLNEQLLDGFEEGLVRLAGNGGDAALLNRVLERVALENRFAAIWRRILSAAIREPAGLQSQMWPLATALPVLVSGDTVELVGRYLKVIFQRLAPADREAVERAILSIRAPDPKDEEFFARRRDRLLGCLPVAYLATPEAQARLRELKASGGPPPNTPLFEMGEATCEEFTEAHWLRSQGVEVDAAPNRRLRELSGPLDHFARQFMNEPPTLEHASEVLPAARELRALLVRGGEGADPRVVEAAATHLAGAVAAIAGAEWLDGDQDLSRFVRDVLLEASRNENPRPDPAREEHYEQHAGYSPSPRICAADGLLDLARFPALADNDVIDAINRLSADACPEVRSAIGRHLGALYRTAPDTFWRLLRRVELAETSRRIIHFTLSGVRPLARQHPAEMLGIAATVFDRFRDDPNAAEIRCICLSIVITANALGEDPFGGGLIRTVISDMARFAAEAVHLVQEAAGLLILGPVAPPDSRQDRLRFASFTFLRGVGQAVQDCIRALEARLNGLPRDGWPPDAQPQIEAALRVAHELGIRTYFASGAFDQKVEKQDARRGELSDAKKQRFLREGIELLGLLAELGIPEVVHNCLETLVAYVQVDPRIVFLTAARAVRHGQVRGYQDDPLAVGLVAGLVRHYIADYRVLFRDDSECRDALLQTLNVFVRAGWPEALDLTSRLDEVFR
jgi:hypothetical protein